MAIVTTGVAGYKLGTELLSIGKKLFGSGKPPWLKYYFSNHWDRYQERFTNEAFFRWHYMFGTDGNPPFSTSEQGKQEIISAVGSGGTSADLYFALFVKPKWESFSTERKNKFTTDIQRGSFDAGNSAGSKFIKLTKWKIVNGNLIFSGSANSQPVSLDTINNKNFDTLGNNTSQQNYNSAVGLGSISSNKLLTPLNITLGVVFSLVLGVTLWKGNK